MKPQTHGMKGRPSIEKLAEISQCSESKVRQTIHQLFAMLEADEIDAHSPRGARR